MTLPKVLFILKYRNSYDYGSYHGHLKSSGLLNSATFVSDMLKHRGFNSHLIEVVDSNNIDRMVTLYKPDIVILEALWVPPDKLNQLRRIHPKIKWVVRLHSEVPFIANEGMAIEWVNKYLLIPNTYIGFNAEEALYDFKKYFRTTGKNVETYLLNLSNYYPVSSLPIVKKSTQPEFNVGCFGAIRPLKNQLIQAFAAIEYARKHELKLKFHINTTRRDNSSADPILKNLRNLFNHSSQYVLVEHDWLDRHKFLHLVRQMDIGLQVSMSETFNIVTADFVSEGIPVVTSNEVDWIPSRFHAETTSVESIVKGMDRAIWHHGWFGWLDISRKALKKRVEENVEIWVETLKALD